jgi:uncharacterized delta-60 repeat protein
VDASTAIDGSAADAEIDASPFSCGGPGSPDLGFGSQGQVPAVFGFGGQAGAGAVLIEPITSRILIAGWAPHEGGSAFAVVRLTPNGTFDPTFGTGGAALVGIPDHDCFINDIVLQPDGKLVAVGGVNDPGAERARLGLLRLNPDGTRDSTFGVDGIVVTEPAGLSQGMGIALDSKSRIVAAVATWDGPNVHDEGRFTTLRYLPSGAADLTFGFAGAAAPAFDTGQDTAYDVVIQAHDRILVAGAVASFGSPVTPRFGVARYLEDGRLDPTYGTNGLASIDVNDAASAFGAALDGSGQPLIVGDASPNFGAIARLTPLGEADATFGQSGIATVQIPRGLRKVAVGGSGEIVAVGNHGVVRFLPNGAVDQTFGSNGVVLPGSIHDLEHDVMVQPDRRVVVVGARMMGTAGVYTSDFFVARYCP